MLQKPSKQQLTFTPDTLQTILEKNLTLYQYFDHLYPILKPGRNLNLDIKLPSKDYSQSFLAASILKMVSDDTNTHYSNLNLILGTSTILNQEAYSYHEIEEALNSKQFIQKLHPYINSLLTTTNIGIVKETLKVHMLMETNIQKSKALHRIKATINILTLYQLEKNTTSVICNLEGLNRIFSKIGLIINKEQYQFYYNQLWNDLPEVDLSSQDPSGMCTSHEKVKNLQIYDLLPLAAELEQIQILKIKLRQWMSSQEFFKYYNKSSLHKRKNSNIQNSCVGIQSQSEQLMQQNLGVVKLRIQHLNSMELLNQIDKRGYNISVHYRQFAQFRKKLLNFHDKETLKRKNFEMINSKSTKVINQNLLNHQRKQKNHIKGNKSNLSASSSKQFSNAGQMRRDNQQKLEQQAFNLKMLNGAFIRDQIMQDIDIQKVNYLDNCFEDCMSDEAIVFNEKTKKKMSQVSIHTKDNQDICKQDIRVTTKTNKTNKTNKTFKSTSRNIYIKKLNQNTLRLQEFNQKKQTKKIYKKMTTSINVSLQGFSSTSTPSASPKKQIKQIKGSDFYDSLMTKIKGQAFYNLGAKILNK